MEKILLKELMQNIEQRIMAKSKLIIAIDGAGGAGKTTLALYLSKTFHGTVISTDKYLDEHMGNYVKFLNHKKIKEDYKRIIDQKNKLLIIEGLCILQILEINQIKHDILIYIKLFDKNGEWCDEILFNEDRDFSEKLEYLDKYETLPGIGNADRELASYHNKFHPIQNADYVLSRSIENDIN